MAHTTVRAADYVSVPSPPEQTAKWSGRGPPPAIGDVVTCNDRGGREGTRVVVTGYEIDSDWLMVLGYREADPTKVGNLAGAEILWPEDA